LGAGERRDHIVRLAVTGGHMIVTELDQCVILFIGLPDAADRSSPHSQALTRPSKGKLIGRR
jgi:hypothetical protein